MSMLLNARLYGFLLLILLIVGAASAQQGKPAVQPNGGRIDLDVVVTPKSGPPVADLQQQDFTLLDNKVPQPIASFKAVNGREAPAEIVLVIDAVNANYMDVSYQRGQIDKFLRSENGQLAHPMALAVFTDEGTKIVQNFSTDGNAVSAALDREDVSLRQIRRDAGFYGATERWQLSLQALTQIVSTPAPRGERKIVVWISPGWPLLSGPEVELDSKQQRQIFGQVVDLSTRMLRERVTLYSIDPVGAGESPLRASYYEEFVRGIEKPSQAQVGDLGLPVIAVQSGGFALSSSNDIAASLQQCLADVEPYYQISFDPVPSERPDGYRALQIRIDRPGLTARTHQGYYAEPSAHE
ncbi:MAG TPA: VWA domain-containing protein [Candidatus Acidoferrales bacterium]|nr:VWA domain-containing protein [Candidatus Acidoferrales bacterium]